MKPSDLSVHVTNFLTHYLAGQRNLSPNTIKAYRDVFILLLRFGRDVRNCHLSAYSGHFDFGIIRPEPSHVGAADFGIYRPV